MPRKERDEKRRDSKGRLLKSGESQRSDGRYAYKYTDTFGNPQFVYSWKLVPVSYTHLDVYKRQVLSFFKSYLLEGIGVFLAVSPIIALVSYIKKSYWLALLLAEIYSFAGLFMSMSSLTKTFYPITALLGVAGYYETTTTNLFESLFVLLLCEMCIRDRCLLCTYSSPLFLFYRFMPDL